MFSSKLKTKATWCLSKLHPLLVKRRSLWLGKTNNTSALIWNSFMNENQCWQRTKSPWQISIPRCKKLLKGDWLRVVARLTLDLSQGKSLLDLTLKISEPGACTKITQDHAVTKAWKLVRDVVSKMNSKRTETATPSHWAASSLSIDADPAEGCPKVVLLVAIHTLLVWVLTQQSSTRKWLGSTDVYARNTTAPSCHSFSRRPFRRLLSKHKDSEVPLGMAQWHR